MLDADHGLAHRGRGKPDVETDHRPQYTAVFRHAFAHRPQVVCIALGRADHHVLQHTRLQQRGQAGLQVRGLRPGVESAGFDQHVDAVRLRERLAQPRQPGRHAVDEARPHDLERRQRRAERRARGLEQRDHGLEIGTTAQRGGNRQRLGLQTQDHARDDPQRALGADQQLLEVVTRVVLDHLVERRHDSAVRQYVLQAQYLVARHAVADHAVAPGVGGQVAAYGAGTARAQVEWKVQPGSLGRALDFGQRRAGQHRHGAHDGVDLLHAAHALQRQHHATFDRVRAAR